MHEADEAAKAKALAQAKAHVAQVAQLATLATLAQATAGHQGEGEETTTLVMEKAS